MDTGILPVGRVIVAAGRWIGFAGWTELAAAVEQARGMAEEYADDVSPSALPHSASWE